MNYWLNNLRTLLRSGARLAGVLWVATLATGLPANAAAPKTVIAWGAGRTSTGTFPEYGQSIVPAGLVDATAIAVGGYHTVALRGDGTVVAWGGGRTSTGYSPEYGQSIVPAGLQGVTAIAAGALHTVALKGDGTVVAWGSNGDGRTTVPTGLLGVTAIAAGGFHTVALLGDGTVVAWGNNDYGQTAVPAGLLGVTAIAAGERHTVALKGDGTVVAWGFNNTGQTTVPAGLLGVTTIAAGGYHTVALKSDGTVVAWGSNDYGQTTVPAGLLGVAAISAGFPHTVALKGDGTVVAWGNNDYGQTAVPAGLLGVTTIAAGGYHTVALAAPSPVLLTPPPAQLVVLSSNATFTVASGGLPPFSYQWRSNGVAIASATNTALTLTNAQLAWSGSQYSVVVTNAYGAITSAVAVLTVELFGTPHISASGSVMAGPNAFGDSATVTMTTAFPIATIYYSKDGSTPFFGGPLTYSGAFTVTTNVILRALAVADDFSSAASAPVSLTIIPTYPLTVGTAGGGAVAKVPSASSYLSNSVVTITATPDAGWTFLYWAGDTNGITGGTAGSAGATNTIRLDRARSVQAVFGTTLATSVSGAGTGTGTVQASPASGPYPYGSVVRLTPKPAVGSYFSLWGNAAAGSGGTNPLDYPVTTPNRTVSALFTALGAGQVTLNVDEVGPGTVTRSPALNVYTAGQTVTLTASNSIMNRFVGWSGDSTATANVISVLLDVSKSVTASFSPVPPGSVVTWGVANIPDYYSQITNVPAGLQAVTAIAASGFNSAAVQNDGTVVAWGFNGEGQNTVPAGLAGVTAVAVGTGGCTVALKDDGTVAMWGRNDYGQATVPAGLSRVVAIATSGYHTVALKNDGTVVAWGAGSTGRTGTGMDFGQSIVPADLQGVTAIACGILHTVALKNDGTVVAWGESSNGRTAVPAGLREVTAIAAGESHTVALKSDGTVLAWGSNNYWGQENVPFDLVGVTAIAAGSLHTVALKHDGTVVAWGRNLEGQTSAPAGLRGVTAIAAGAYHTVGLIGDAHGPVPPSLLIQPPSQTVLAGGSVTFNVAPAGSAPFSYQWRANDVSIAGATTATFSLVNVQASSAASYSVVITNAYGAITSAPALLTVDSRQEQTITFDPLPAKVSTDAPFPLTASASSGLAVTYASSNPGVAAVSGNTVTLVGPGTVTLTASQGGNLAFRPAASVSRLLTVNAPANPPPVVTLTSPAAQQSFLPNVPVTLAATATDANGVSSVKFYANGQLIGEDASAPYTLAWTPPGAGFYTLQATALDTLGVLGVSAETQVSVQSVPPVVGLLSPANGSVFALPANVTLTGYAFDPDGFDNLVARVEFLAGATVIGTVLNPAGTSVSFIWTNPPPGQHELRVRATDAVGFVEESSPKTITVNYPAGAVPTFSFALAEYRVSEAAGTVTLTVLKNPSPGGTVNFATVDGTARAAAGFTQGDYIAQAGPLTFAANQERTNLTITIVNDLGREGDQSFTVQLTPVGGALVASPAVATVVILDDDPAPSTGSVAFQPPTNALPAFNALGALRVSVQPNVGQWRLLWDTVWHRHDDVLDRLQPGSYEVVFQPREGFVTPANLVAQVGAGATLSITGLYSATTALQTGSLRVDLTPGTTQWRVQGEAAWRASGATVASLVAGPYVVEFDEGPSGLLRPAPAAVTVGANSNSVLAVTYGPNTTPFELSPADPGQLHGGAPYAGLGQLLSESGYGSGTAVRRRVVLTAGHLAFNDRTLTFATNVYWFHRRYAGTYEPRPQQPRGAYVFAGYAGQRTTEGTPGLSTPASQTLDAAALFFYEDAAGGGQSGYLVSDPGVSWLGQGNDKLLLGYPLNAPALLTHQRKLQAVERVNVTLEAVAGVSGVFTTTRADFRSTAGNSGGPLSVKFGGVYYPAGIFLGGTAQSVVRAIDADVVDLINRAELTANTGDNNTDGGQVDYPSYGVIPVGAGVGMLTVNLGGQPAGAGWRLVPPEGAAGAFITGANVVTQRFVFATNLLEFAAVAGHLTPGRVYAPVTRDGTQTVSVVYARTNDFMNTVPGRPGPGGFAFEVRASSFGRYVVYGRADFGTGAWVPLVTNTLGVDGRHTYTNPPGTSNRFFRTEYVTSP